MADQTIVLQEEMTSSNLTLEPVQVVPLKAQDSKDLLKMDQPVDKECKVAQPVDNNSKVDPEVAHKWVHQAADSRWDHQEADNRWEAHQVDKWEEQAITTQLTQDLIMLLKVALLFGETQTSRMVQTQQE
jgi:hypothetical protein